MAALNRPRSFIVAYLTLIFLAMAGMAAINIVVDPFWRFDLISIPGFNAQKVEFASNLRMAKPGVVCRLQPITVVMGTSRAEVGINPTHPALRDVPGPVYNLSLSGAGLNELDMTLRHAVHASPGLKRVLLGLDFFLFNANRNAVVFGTEVLNFDQQRLLLLPNDHCWRSFLYDIDALLGPKGLIFSFKTITGQIPEPTSRPQVNRWLANFDRNGFRNNFYIIQKILIPERGYRQEFADTQERYYAKRIWRSPPEERFCFVAGGQPNTFDTLRSMIRFTRASGIDLRIFFNPVHARLLIALREAGLWPLYEDWKRGVVDVLAAESAASGKPQYPLWDFSGFNSITTEPVPPAGDTKTIMRGFWEPSHYKEQIGDLMLDRMLDYREPTKVVPEDFGKMLTSATIDSWIKQTRIGMREYMRTEPAEAALVKSAVEDVLTGSDGSNCGYDVKALRDATAARKRGDLAVADAAFARATELHEADRRRYADLDVPFRETSFDHLLAEAKAGAELTPRLLTWQAYQERGIQRSAKGDYRGAADDFALAVRIGPVNTALHFLRGVALLNAGDATAAAKEFEDGLKLDPGNVPLAQLLKKARSEEKMR